MPMNLKEFQEKMKDPEYRNRGADRCCECDAILNLAEPLGPYQINDGLMCSDCYFEIFGREIEENPIHMPSSIRDRS
jgi:hypothetical protein